MVVGKQKLTKWERRVLFGIACVLFGPMLLHAIIPENHGIGRNLKPGIGDTSISRTAPQNRGSDAIVVVAVSETYIVVQD